MFRELVALLLFVSGIGTASAALDLTPVPAEYTAEGITVRQLLFRDGEDRISYEPPRGWAYRYENGKLELEPPEKSHAHAEIGVTELAVPQNVDDKLLSALRQEFVATLPPGAQKTAVSPDELNPTPVGGHLSFGMSASYQTLGEVFVRSTVYVFLRKSRLRFQVTARKGDFEAVNRAFRASILTWRWSQGTQAAAVPALK